MIEPNEDIRSGEVRKALADISLYEAIIHKQREGTRSTYEYESHSIDIVFISTTLTTSKGGYLPFHQYETSDQQSLWIDLSYQVVFGHILPEAVKMRR